MTTTNIFLNFRGKWDSLPLANDVSIFDAAMQLAHMLCKQICLNEIIDGH